MLVNIWPLLALLRFRGAFAWDYSVHGANWDSQGMCGKDGPQSPINLPPHANEAEELTMFLKYPKLDSTVKVYHNGKSIAFTLPEDFKAGFGIGKGSDGVKTFGSEDGKAYRLWQVNFHSPSEHTINGKRLPLEMQMMHQQVTGGDGLAVVVVLFELVPNAYGEFLDGILGRGLPQKPWEETIRQPPFEFSLLLGGSAYYTYQGSLTVPPCEQQVRYFVRKDTVPAAYAQLRQFSQVLQDTCKPNGNYRALQRQSGPVVLLSSADVVSGRSIVRPRPPTLEQEKMPVDKKAEGKGNCTSEYFDKVYKNHQRIQTGDSKEMVKLKTQLNSAKRELQVRELQISSFERQVHESQRLYDHPPGIVEKIEAKVQLTLNEQALNAALKDLSDLHYKADYALNALKMLIFKMCAPDPNAPVLVLEDKATRHWDYAAPHVVLPRGLGASPFSKKNPDGTKVVVSKKIAVNLQQAEGPEGASIQSAAGKGNKALRYGGNPETTLDLMLPISRKAAGDESEFSNSLVNAMAEIGHIPKDRLQVKEIRDASVAKVHGTSSAVALVQEYRKELRKNLRHRH